MPVKLQVKRRLKERPRLKAIEVESLSLTSNVIRDELAYRTALHLFSAHTFFASIDEFGSNLMKELVKSAVDTMEFAAGDVIFEEGAVGDQTYYITIGSLVYMPGMATTDSLSLAGSHGEVGVERRAGRVVRRARA